MTRIQMQNDQYIWLQQPKKKKSIHGVRFHNYDLIYFSHFNISILCDFSNVTFLIKFMLPNS